MHASPAREVWPLLKAWLAIGLLLASIVEASDPPAGSNPVVTAIQERAFAMNQEIVVGVGILPADPFTKGLYAQAGYVIHFSDSIAWQVARGAYVYNVATSTKQQLIRDFAVSPKVFDSVEYFAGSDLLIKPLYGKLSLFNRYSLHGEAYILLGGSVFKFTTAPLIRPAVNLGGGFRVFASKHASFRFDVTDQVIIPIGGSGKTAENILSLNLSLGINLGTSE